MPELPEVETTCRGIAPHITGKRVTRVIVRNPNLRWPVSARLDKELTGQTINNVARRAKYLLLQADAGTAILHLGMSGSIRICVHDEPLKKHDHFILRLDNNMELRLHDPRRFGAVLWHPAKEGDVMKHLRLKDLGPEPLEHHFQPSNLIESCQGKTTTIKQHIMNNYAISLPEPMINRRYNIYNDAL